MSISSVQNQPAVPETTFCGSCSQFVYDVINKVKDVFMAILQTILPCFFASENLDASRVTQLNTGSTNESSSTAAQTVQQAQAQLAQSSVADAGAATQPVATPSGGQPVPPQTSTSQGGQQELPPIASQASAAQASGGTQQPAVGSANGQPVAGGEPAAAPAEPPVRNGQNAAASAVEAPAPAGPQNMLDMLSASADPLAEQMAHIGAWALPGMGAGGVPPEFLAGAAADPLVSSGGGDGADGAAVSQQDVLLNGLFERSLPPLNGWLPPPLVASTSGVSASSASASALPPFAFSPGQNGVAATASSASSSSSSSSLLPPSNGAGFVLGPWGNSVASRSADATDESAAAVSAEPSADGEFVDEETTAGAAIAQLAASQRQEQQQQQQFIDGVAARQLPQQAAAVAGSDEEFVDAGTAVEVTPRRPRGDTQFGTLFHDAAEAHPNGNDTDPNIANLMSAAAAAASAAAEPAADEDGGIFSIPGLSTPAAANGVAAMPPSSSAAAFPANPSNPNDSTDVPAGALARAEQYKAQLQAMISEGRAYVKKKNEESDFKETVGPAKRTVFIESGTVNAPAGFFAACAVATDWKMHKELMTDGSEMDELLNQALNHFGENSEEDPWNVVVADKIVLTSLGDIRSRQLWTEVLLREAETRAKASDEFMEPMIVIFTNVDYSVSHALRITANGKSLVYDLFSPNSRSLDKDFDPIYQTFKKVGDLRKFLPKANTKYYAFELTEYDTGTTTSEEFATAAAAAALPPGGVHAQAAGNPDT